jgi:eukaryotic-like serine/threonine-protein kinase
MGKSSGVQSETARATPTMIRIIRICRKCSAKILSDAPEGLCTRCTLKTALGMSQRQSVAGAAAPSRPASSMPTTARDDVGPASNKKTAARAVGLLGEFGDYEEPDVLVGQMIGHYKISKLIGAGGMGEVYVASDVRAGRNAALKIVPTRFTGDTARLKRFQQEARAVAGLNHPNILTVYEVGGDKSIEYIASELIEGETLRERLAGGRIQLNEAIEIAIQVASALAAAHDAGIVHRDVKPENIMLRRDGYVKVLDFGIAKLAEQEVPVTMAEEEAMLLIETNLGAVLGTVRYMSPEQARGAPIDKRTDIWSLGVVLFEMLAGRAPFTGKTPREVMAAILTTEPPPLRSYMAQAPSELQQIVRKALRKDPRERHQNANEMLQALKGLRRKLEFTAELERSAATRLWLRWTRSPMAVGLVLFLAGVALALPFYWHRNPTTSSIPEKSIAVLPFAHLSPDPNDAYFTQGIEDEILTRLAKIADLKVISRTSVMSYTAGRKRDLREIGHALGVGQVLEGSVRRADGKVRVTAQLIDTRTNTHVWAETYDRGLADVFAIQGDIAQQIATQLRAKLTGSEKSAIAKRPTPDRAAYELYLKGRFFWNKRTAADLRKAIDYFNQALAKDPNFAAAYAGLADTYVLLPGYAAGTPRDAFPKAKVAAQKALELDDTLAEAHTSLAAVSALYEFDLTRAASEFKRAIELNPNYATAHQWYGGQVLAKFGRFDEAIAETKRALELDPLSLILNANLGYTYYQARQYDLAIDQIRKTIEMEPRFDVAHFYLGQALQAKGDLAGAITEYEKAYELRQNPWALGLLAQAIARQGRRDEALRILGQLQIESTRTYVPPLSFALVHLGLGDKAEALHWVEKSYEDRAGDDLLVILSDPLVDSLRGEPRFKAIVQKVFAPK